jgi:MFS family permease
VGLFQFVPALLLVLPAGQAADRFNRATIFALCALAQAVVATVCVAALQYEFQSRAVILGLSVALGVIRAFQMPAQQALTPSLVSDDLLARAIALSSSAMQVGIIGGPALGGLIYALEPRGTYAICAVLAFASLLSMRGVRGGPRPMAQTRVTWDDVWAGLRFVQRQRILLGAVTLDMFAVLLGGATALLPIYAKDVLMVGPQGLGLLRACPAVGALVMSLVLTRWPIRRHIGRALFASIAIFGLATVVFGISHHLGWSVLALLVIGAADNVSVVIRSTVMQLETPEHMRGRVSAINAIFIGASNQLGEFESGAVAAWWGPQASVISGGLGTLLVALCWWRWFPQLANRDRYKADGSAVR